MSHCFICCFLELFIVRNYTFQNQFPTRDQRLDLARICNEAEVAMNNGAKVRGPEGDTEGITEQRVNTWFTNRRKGLGTPITPPPPNKGRASTQLY